MPRILPVLAVLAVLAGLALASADAFALEGWLRTRKDGLEAAGKSGKPVLVVTIWKDGV